VVGERIETESHGSPVSLMQSDPLGSDRIVALGNHTADPVELLHVDASGEIEAGATLPATVQAAIRLDDGSVLVSELDAGGRLARFDALSGDPRPALQVPDGPGFHASQPDLSVDDAGSTAATGRQSEPLRVTRFGPDGTIRWQRELGAPPQGRLQIVDRVVSNRSRSCVLSLVQGPPQQNALIQQLDCFSNDDGGDLYRQVEVSTASAHTPMAQLGDDGSLRLVVEEPGPDLGTTLSFVTLDPDGVQIGMSDILAEEYRVDPERFQIGIERHRSLVPLPGLEVYDIAGQSLFQSLHTSDLAFRRLIGIDAGHQVLLTQALPGEGPTLTLEQRMSGSEIAWNRAYPGWSACGELTARALSGHDWLLAFAALDSEQVNVLDQACARTILARISSVDGRVIWSVQTSSAVELADLVQPLLVDEQHGVVALLSSSKVDGAREQRIVWRSLHDGGAVAAASLPASSEQISRLVPGSDGEVFSVGTQRAPQTSHTVVARHGFPLAEPTLPLSQTGIRGAWYSTVVEGQGLFFDHLPDADRLYAGWFTHRSEGGHDPAGLRWFLLVADSAESDSGVSFAIERHTRGRFLQPGGEVERVGRATLRLLDCNRANFSYRFDAADLEDEESAIDLRRSAAASYSCVQDTQQTSIPSVPATRGLDARFGGAWQLDGFDGQGIAFELRPPQADDDGLFAGAWFTYDMADDADDPTTQHWFTLSGDLGDATDGRLTVPIYRTIGGSLDRESTNNTWRIGTATIRFNACDSATLDYEFDPIEVAHQFSGLQGTATLSRVGGCAE
jgi:hypothetical protein